MQIHNWTICILILVIGCKKPDNQRIAIPPPVTVPSSFVKGADISWLTQMESGGYLFYDSTGAAMDCIEILKELGINSIRLRAWVDPSGGWCNTYDVAVKALRAKNLGMRIMIDFHYSDVWADPGHQTKPAAWANETVDSLVSTLSGYTSYVLDTLQSIGIFADWVQVGNETDNGMLWPTAMASDSLPNYARLINAGYNAVKSVNDSTKVIVHLSGGNDNNHFRWLFDQLDSFGVQYDIIGMSLYPPTGGWQAEDSECLANMNDMVNRYHKQVMVCEVGMPADSAFTCEAFLTDMIARIKSVSGGNGLGLFYWEPECYNWEGYTMGAFDSTGRPTVALNAFLH